MKKLILVALSGALLLTACSSPNYGTHEEQEDTSTSSTDVVSLYGVVIAVTDDNQLEIKVNKPDEVENTGLEVNEDGIVKVALAATDMSGLNSEGNEALNSLLTTNILNEDVMIEVVDPQQSKDIVEGFVSFANENDSIILLQDMIKSEFVSDLVNSEALNAIKPHLSSLQEIGKNEIKKMLKIIE